jgi:hypothetical protein
MADAVAEQIAAQGRRWAIREEAATMLAPFGIRGLVPLVSGFVTTIARFAMRRSAPFGHRRARRTTLGACLSDPALSVRSWPRRYWPLLPMRVLTPLVAALKSPVDCSDACGQGAGSNQRP